MSFRLCSALEKPREFARQPSTVIACSVDPWFLLCSAPFHAASNFIAAQKTELYLHIHNWCMASQQSCRPAMIIINAVVKPSAWMPYILSWRQIMLVYYLVVMNVVATPYHIRYVVLPACSAMTKTFPGGFNTLGEGVCSHSLHEIAGRQ
jgi:hypothetical protein